MPFPWHKNQWSQVNQLIKTERLPHAMLLLGNQGLGKFEFAMEMASSILCKQPAENAQSCGLCQACQLLSAGTHPDLHVLKPKPPKTSKSKNPVLSIRIDDVRELCAKLNQTSQYGGYRIAIFENAELMTLSAANSLLKTLEEPGQNVLIILVTSRLHRLPVTIRSRCQTLRFTEPVEAEGIDWLKQQEAAQHASPLQLQQVFRQAHGAPLAALNQLAEAEHDQLLCEAMTAQVSGKNSLEYAAKLAKFAKVPTLEAMMSWATDLSRLHAGGPAVELTHEQYRSKLQALATKANKQRLFRFYDQLNFNLLHSSIAVNEQLLWENLLISWDNL